MPDKDLDNALVIIGDEDVISGFKALGFKTYFIKEHQGAVAVIDEALEEKPCICLVQENLYSLAEDRIREYKTLPLPIFIPFSPKADWSLLQNMLKEIRIRATGAL